MIAAVLLAGLHAAAAPPQGEVAAPAVPSSRAPVTLHQAWLVEVLDLDTTRAAALYAEVAARRGPGHFDPWVAVARLLELRRLGVATPAVDLAAAPRELRAPFTAAQAPLDLVGLAQRAGADPPTLLQSLARPAGGEGAADAGRLPPLRPVVAEAESWVLAQIGPSPRDRQRQRWDDLRNNRALLSDRIYANRILDAELGDLRDKADALRTLHFASWQPPAVPADHARNLARLRRNLEELLDEREVTRTQRELLQRLRATIERLAATDPGAAVAFLLRLPWYAERLLRETPGGNR